MSSRATMTTIATLFKRPISNSSSPVEIQSERRTSNSSSLAERRVSNSSSPAERRTSHSSSLAERRTSNSSSLAKRRASNSSSLAERRTSNSSSPVIERRTSHSSSLAERRTSNSSSLAKRRASNSSSLAERRTSNSSSPVIERRTSNSSSPADRRISHCHGYILPKDTRLSWIGLIACFMGHVLAVGGPMKSFGVFFVDIQTKYNAPASDTAWIISITMCVTMATGLVGNVLLNRFGPRRVTLLSAFLMCSGCVLSSFAPSIRFLYFSYGVVTGIGCGMTFAVSISAAGHYFEKYRAVAMGIVFAGNGFGSFALAPLLRYLIDEYGVGGALLLHGAIVSHMAVFAMLHLPKQFHHTHHRLQQRKLRTRTFKAAETGSVGLVNVAYDSSRHDVVKGEDGGVNVNVVELLYAEVDNDVSNGTPRPDGELVDVTARPKENHVTARAAHKTPPPTTPNDDNNSPIDDASPHDVRSCNQQKAVRTSLSRVRSLASFSLLTKPYLILHALTAGLIIPPYFIVYVTLPPHAQQLGFRETSVALFVSVAGIVEVIFRILNGFFVNLRLVRNHVLYKGGIVATAVAVIAIPHVGGYMLAFVVFVFVISSSLFIVLQPILLAEGLGVVHLPVAFGIAMLVESVMFLAMPVIAGKLRDISGQWDVSFYSLGGVLLSAAAINLLHPWAAEKLSRERDSRTIEANVDR